jgi:hypothetical protein
VGKAELSSLDVLDRPEDYFDKYEKIDPAQMEVLQAILHKGTELNQEDALISRILVKRNGFSPNERHKYHHDLQSL